MNTEDCSYPLAITEAVLGNERPTIRARVLRLWVETLELEKKVNPRLGIFPEADHIVDLIEWLASVADSLDQDLTQRRSMITIEGCPPSDYILIRAPGGGHE